MQYIHDVLYVHNVYPEYCTAKYSNEDSLVFVSAAVWCGDGAKAKLLATCMGTRCRVSFCMGIVKNGGLRFEGLL